MALRRPLADAIDTLRNIVREDAPFDPTRLDGVLRLAATEHAMAAVVQRFVAVLRRAAPQLAVHIEPADADVFSLLSGGRLDLVVAPKIGPTSKGLFSQHLWEERFVTVLRRGNPAAHERLTLRRFCALEHVVVAPVGGDRPGVVSEALVQRGLERRVAVRVPYFASAIEIVSTSDLALTLPASMAPQRLAIRRPPLALPGFVLEAVLPQRLRDSELHRWVVQLTRPPGASRRRFLRFEGRSHHDRSPLQPDNGSTAAGQRDPVQHPPRVEPRTDRLGSVSRLPGAKVPVGSGLAPLVRDAFGTVTCAVEVDRSETTMRTCPRCSLISPDSATVCECGCPLNATPQEAAITDVAGNRTAADLRARAAIALIVGLVCLIVPIHALVLASRHEQVTITFSGRLACLGPSLLTLGVLYGFFTRRALDRRGRLKPLGWAILAVGMGISFAFMVWVDKKFGDYGYRRPSVGPQPVPVIPSQNL